MNEGGEIQTASEAECEQSCTDNSECIGFWTAPGNGFTRCGQYKSITSFSEDSSETHIARLRIIEEDSGYCCLFWNSDETCEPSTWQIRAPYTLISNYNVPPFTDLGNGCVMESMKTGYYSGTIIGSERNDVTSKEDCQTACCNISLKKK